MCSSQTIKGMTFIEKKLCNSIAIPIAKLHPFEGHPYIRQGVEQAFYTA